MRILMSIALSFFLFLSSAISAMGVERIRLYAMPSYAAGHAGQIFMMGSQETMKFQISLGHEAGSEPVVLPAAPSELFVAQLNRLTEEDISAMAGVTMTWSPLPSSYSVTGETVEQSSVDPSRVSPGAGRHWQLEVRQASGVSFEPGHYALNVLLEPGALTLPAGDRWTGRWTGVSTTFQIREITNTEDHLLLLQLEGYRARSEGRIEDALALYEELQLLEPSACFPMAMLQLQLGQHRSALDCFELLPAEVDSHSTLPLYKAFAHLAIGESAIAREILDAYTESGTQADVWVSRFHGKLNEGPPTAKLDVSCENLTCTFDARGSTDDYGIFRYLWQFGDGSSVMEGPEAIVQHEYSEEGEYQVTLTVIDGSQLEDSTQEMTDMIDIIELILHVFDQP